MDAIEKKCFFERLQIDFRQFDVSIMKFYPKELELLKCVKTEHVLNASVATDLW